MVTFTKGGVPQTLGRAEGVAVISEGKINIDGRTFTGSSFEELQKNIESRRKSVTNQGPTATPNSVTDRNLRKLRIAFGSGTAQDIASQEQTERLIAEGIKRPGVDVSIGSPSQVVVGREPIPEVKEIRISTTDLDDTLTTAQRLKQVAQTPADVLEIARAKGITRLEDVKTLEPTTPQKVFDTPEEFKTISGAPIPISEPIKEVRLKGREADVLAERFPEEKEAGLISKTPREAFFQVEKESLDPFRQSISEEISTFKPVKIDEKLVGFRDVLQKQSVGITKEQAIKEDTERFARGGKEAQQTLIDKALKKAEEQKDVLQEISFQTTQEKIGGLLGTSIIGGATVPISEKAKALTLERVFQTTQERIGEILGGKEDDRSKIDGKDVGTDNGGVIAFLSSPETKEGAGEGLREFLVDPFVGAGLVATSIRQKETEAFIRLITPKEKEAERIKAFREKEIRRAEAGGIFTRIEERFPDLPPQLGIINIGAELEKGITEKIELQKGVPQTAKGLVKEPTVQTAALTAALLPFAAFETARKVIGVSAVGLGGFGLFSGVKTRDPVVFGKSLGLTTIGLIGSSEFIPIKAERIKVSLKSPPKTVSTSKTVKVLEKPSVAKPKIPQDDFLSDLGIAESKGVDFVNPITKPKFIEETVITEKVIQPKAIKKDISLIAIESKTTGKGFTLFTKSKSIIKAIPELLGSKLSRGSPKFEGESGITLGRFKPKKTFELAELTSPVEAPRTAQGTKILSDLLKITPKEKARVGAIQELVKAELKTKGLKVKDPLFPIEEFRDPKAASKIIEKFVAEEGGEFFGSATVEQLPKGFRLKPGDIDVSFPTRTESEVKIIASELARRLSKIGEDVSVSADNPLNIVTSKGTKVFEGKAGIGATSLSGDPSGVGALGFDFAKSGSKVKFGKAKATRAGEQLARKGAASTFFRGESVAAETPLAFREAGVLPKGKRTGDISGFIAQAEGLAEIKISSGKPIRVIEGLREKALTKKLFKTFTSEQKLSIEQTIIEKGGFKIRLGELTKKQTPDLSIGKVTKSLSGEGFIPSVKSPRVVQDDFLSDLGIDSKRGIGSPKPFKAEPKGVISTQTFKPKQKESPKIKAKKPFSPIFIDPKEPVSLSPLVKDDLFDDLGIDSKRRAEPSKKIPSPAKPTTPFSPIFIDPKEPISPAILKDSPKIIPEPSLKIVTPSPKPSPKPISPIFTPISPKPSPSPKTSPPISPILSPPVSPPSSPSPFPSPSPSPSPFPSPSPSPRPSPSPSPSPRPSPSPSPSPKPSPSPPISPPIKKRSRRPSKFSQGYDVFIRTGKPVGGRVSEIKANTRSLPKNKASNLGSDIVDKSTARSFRIEKSSRTSLKDDKTFKLEDKFRRPKGKSQLKKSFLVEKSKNAIDSAGERRGITAKGLIESRRKAKSKTKKNKKKKAKNLTTNKQSFLKAKKLQSKGLSLRSIRMRL